MKACILVATKSDPRRVVERLEPFAGIMDAFAVQKRKEVVVRVELRGMTHLADVLDRLSAIEDVIVSETLLEIPQVVRG